MDELIERLVDAIVLILMKIFYCFKDGKKYCGQQKVKIGLLNSDEIEQYHSFFWLQNNILQEERNILIIGSPHLKYWFETQDEPRMIRFLRNTRYVKVSVILYGNMDEKVLSGLQICKNEFTNRFLYNIVDESSSISYIFYKFRIRKKVYSRCIVGFQKTNYTARPFIEFISRDGMECEFVKSIIFSHNKIFELEENNEEAFIN